MRASNDTHMQGFGTGIKRFFFLPCAAIALLLVVFSCSKKTQIEYVDREVVKYKTQIRHDTLTHHIHDSIYQTVFQVGDTIYNTKYIEHIKYIDRTVNLIDTVTKDSIQYKYRYIDKVKEKTPKWCYYCLLVSCILSIFVGVILYKRIKRWLKH